ncbi:MAG: bifunctional folylpolyglutamate synthase/dihydrofolate synthase [Rhodospirillales bacterium]|nr:bifunctional folylpolyglutamate synthase/dihydrofolate synthase [Rhodospirillales bacterium]
MTVCVAKGAAKRRLPCTRTHSPSAKIASLSSLRQSDAVLARLKALHPRVIDLSLDRIARLLADLGHPERALPPVIHVAGTNGKGSLIAFLKAILEAACLRVHVYTSPHLVRFSERIVVAGAEIEEERLAAVLEECDLVNAGRSITFFEITTAAAFLAFSRSAADVTLLETGLGGRLDATNLIDRPLLTAITPISLDHRSFLGSTVREIAGEKAGILKPGVRCVVGAQTRDAADVIAVRAAEVGAPLLRQDREWSVRGAPQGVIYECSGRALQLPHPALPGRHQIDNAGAAIACARSLTGIDIDNDALARGLREAAWPARLQHLEGGRLRALLPPDWELWLDGGHNPAAGAALAVQAHLWRDRPLFVVFGMLDSKDPVGFLVPLAPYVERLVAVEIPSEPGSMSARMGIEAGEVVGIVADAATSIEGALEALARDCAAPARVLICGSLHLAGAALAANAFGSNLH